MPSDLKVGWILFQTRLNIIFDHRTDLILWLTSGFISLLFTLSIWKAFRPEDMFQHLWQFYVIAGIVSGLTSERFYHRISQDIHRGELSKYLLQPYPYLFRNLFNILASGTINLLVNLITLFLISRQFGTSFQLTLTSSQIISSIPLIIIGWWIAALISFLIGCIAFVWIRPGALYLVLDVTFPFLIGASLPLWMLPDNYQWLIEILPTRWIASAPLEVLLNSNTTYLTVLVSGLAWLVFLSLLSRYLWKRVLHLYEAVGG